MLKTGPQASIPTNLTTRRKKDINTGYFFQGRSEKLKNDALTYIPEKLLGARLEQLLFLSRGIDPLEEMC